MTYQLRWEAEVGRNKAQWPQKCLVTQHKSHLCSPHLSQHCNVADTWKEAILPSYTENIFVP